jgi:hypothetical protein
VFFTLDLNARGELIGIDIMGLGLPGEALREIG